MYKNLAATLVAACVVAPSFSQTETTLNFSPQHQTPPKSALCMSRPFCPQDGPASMKKDAWRWSAPCPVK